MHPAPKTAKYLSYDHHGKIVPRRIFGSVGRRQEDSIGTTGGLGHPGCLPPGFLPLGAGRTSTLEAAKAA
ncbi:hypothetical protein CCUS01_14967 [Colletotrichum cuscutae]|uniref:Uncharacterized protein n=1 Tax=Colletotrichum cuscutae TaxID=1209917 RepID=A0AAI9VHV1_9PEZI|nr:hypothetical protein CCUS01_14967 [Colletotrichum cuscutae]